MSIRPGSTVAFDRSITRAPSGTDPSSSPHGLDPVAAHEHHLARSRLARQHVDESSGADQHEFVGSHGAEHNFIGRMADGRYGPSVDAP